MRKILREQFVQYVVLVICLGVIVKYFADRKGEVSQIFNLRGADVIFLGLLALLIHFLVGYKMLFILRKLGLKQLPYLPWFNVFTVSRFLNFHLIQGGNLYRGIKLKRDYAFSYTHSVGMMVIFSWFEAVFILVISMAMVATFGHGVSISGVSALRILVILLFPFLLLPVVIKIVLRQRRVRSSSKVWGYEKLMQLAECFTSNVRDCRLLLILFALSFSTFLLSVWQIHAAFKAIGTPIGLSETAVFTAITLLSGIVSITPSNIGITELIYGYLSILMGKSLGSGIIICSMLRILGYLVVVICAVFFSGLVAIRNNKGRSGSSNSD